MVGKTIRQYRIQEAIGKGGMGAVYKALDTQLNRVVVLKLLSRELLGHEKARSRFLREARLASALDHPNICTIYEIQESEGFYYIAMQFVEGQTLKQAINKRPLANSTILSISLQFADALAMAHDRGIIHRDIKPQNIMLTPRGQVKVLDFGLAKSVDESTAHLHADLTEHGKTLGTPSYMSPEQARSERIDRRADIFSFGTVLYEMVTGRKAFAGDNNVDIMYAVCNLEPKAVAELNPNLLPGIQEILTKALAKDPAQRYQNMHELLADLKEVSSGSVQMTVPDGIHQPYAEVKRAPRNWFNQFIPSFLRKKKSGSSSISGLDAGGLTDLSQTQAQRRGKPGERTPDFSLHDDFPLIPGQHKTLAVLPFRNLASQMDDAWRVSFLEALIAEMTKFKALTIRPSSAVLQYFDDPRNATEIGRDLGVDAILLGSLLGTETRLRAVVQMIDISSGSILWAGKIDAEESDSLRLQDALCKGLLEHFKGKKEGNAALDLLKDESPDVRIDAILALKTSNDLTALNELADALKDPILEVKSAAAEVLGYHGKNATTAVLAALDESLGKRQFQTARFGVRAAGIIGSTEFVPVLLDALTCEDGFVASEAALALGKIRDLRACPDLIDALQHKDANVRFAAVQALGNLADPQAVSALETRLRDDSDEGIQAKALWAINRIRRKPFGTSTMTAIHTSTNLK